MPLWLAREVIESLSELGDTVLDPMVGSGTTAVAALRCGRHAIGTDLDPMALLLSHVSTSVYDTARARKVLDRVREGALRRVRCGLTVATARGAFGHHDQEFLKYWFPPRSQKELYALALAIEALPMSAGQKYRNLARVVLSSLVIAKSAGASYALDISRSRPHKVEDKPIVNPLEVWDARAKIAIDRLPFKADRACKEQLATATTSRIRRADARHLPVEDASVDLVVTSPPYINAIDYLRSHKFSLVWMGHPLADLRELRSTMIGTERGMYTPDSLPPKLEETIVDRIEQTTRLGQVRRYLSDMRRVLLELKRVLKPGGTIVIALGPSVIDPEKSDAGDVIGGLAEAVGLIKVGAVFRPLDPSRRSLPPPFAVGRSNPLRLRMDGEVFLGLLKNG
jgi:SAM-dependent methyltransferase